MGLHGYSRGSKGFVLLCGLILDFYHFEGLRLLPFQITEMLLSWNLQVPLEHAIKVRAVAKGTRESLMYKSGYYI